MDRNNHSSVAALDDTGGGDIQSMNRVDHTSRPSMEESDHGSRPSVNDADNNEVVILIVGNRAEDKIGLVDSLTKTGQWKNLVDNLETNKGVRVFTCTSPARVIVDTTPLTNVPDRSPTIIARRWISRNSLRRLIFGKDVIVVCVLTSTVRNSCRWDTLSNVNCWLDVFGLIFATHKQEIMMLVNTEGEQQLSAKATSNVEQFVHGHGFSTKKITYSNLKGDVSLRAVIEDGISRGNAEGPRRRLDGQVGRKGKASNRPAREPVHSTVMPFYFGDASSDGERFGIWGPERMLLFGKTGSGKSTLAQMLTLGGLDNENTTFVPSPGITGGTREVQPGIGRGWYVLDTPGFGEPDTAESTVPTRVVQKRIKKYVRMVEGTFSHYLYVVKKDRLDVLEQRLWQFFVLLFGEDMNSQFTVVVSDADAAWIKDNHGPLQACFKGCKSFLGAEFPAIVENDEGLESVYKEMRTESLLKLENGLAKLNRFDRQCRYGKRSKMQLTLEKIWADSDLAIERNERIKYLVRGAAIIFTCCNISNRPFAELTNLLKVNDKITLVPL